MYTNTTRTEQQSERSEQRSERSEQQSEQSEQSEQRSEQRSEQQSEQSEQRSEQRSEQSEQRSEQRSEQSEQSQRSERSEQRSNEIGNMTWLQLEKTFSQKIFFALIHENVSVFFPQTRKQMKQIHASHQREKKLILFTVLTGRNFQNLSGYGRSRGNNFPPHVFCVWRKSLKSQWKTT